MFVRLFKFMVLPAALALLVSMSSFARPKNERSVSIPDPVQVGSTHLKAGTYRVEWQERGSSLQVTFWREGKIVTTAVGKMVEKKQSWPTDEIITANVDKTQRLKEIDFGGTKDSLVFPSNETSMK